MNNVYVPGRGKHINGMLRKLLNRFSLTVLTEYGKGSDIIFSSTVWNSNINTTKYYFSNCFVFLICDSNRLKEVDIQLMKEVQKLSALLTICNLKV